MSYLASLNPLNLLGAMPGNVAQGLIWGLMALGVYITFRLLDFADLTVDGSFATGGAVTVVLILHGWSVPPPCSSPSWPVWLPDSSPACSTPSWASRPSWPVS